VGAFTFGTFRAMAIQVYDSAKPTVPFVSEFGNLWSRRGLLRLLVVRDLTMRYKRSVLGMWWTLLNPLLEMAVLWLVFSHIFRFSAPGIPYVVYLLSGIILYGIFRDTVMTVSASLSANAAVVTKIRVPAEAFTVSAALAIYVGFLISLLVFVCIMLASGVPIPSTLPLALIPTVLLLVFAIGVGMIAAPFAARFPDLLDFERVGLVLLGYLAPVFYPYSIVPRGFRFVERLNPIFHFLGVFRATVYGGVVGDLRAYGVMAGCALGALVIGGFVFSRMRLGMFDVF
jgi:ABC-type polysaccharide/polyol phosphate export permease